MKKILYIFAILIVGAYFIFGLINTVSRIGEVSNADTVVMVIVLVLVALFELFLIKRYKKSFNANAISERETQKAEAASEKFNKESLILGSKARRQLLGADICIKVNHMTGLPIAEGAEVYVYRCENKVVFERNQDTFELESANMKDILIKTDVEIQKNYVSSVGGAVGGYVLFGPLGAMVGGRAKEKKSTTVEKYLIFDYINKEGKQDFISFEVTNEPNAILFNTNHFNLMKNERVTVTL